MFELALSVVLLVIGLAFLVKGADWIVKGASSIAKHYGISPLIVGLTIVTFGTTTPELAVNLFSGFNNYSELAIGNILGSNIFNILVIIGLTAMIFQIRTLTSVKKEAYFSLLGVGILLLFSFLSLQGEGTGVITFLEGALMILFFFIYLFILYKTSTHHHHKEYDKKAKWKSILLVVVGVILLSIGGQFVVSNAVQLALAIGISQFLIGLTIVSAGTSLPELVTSIVAAIRKEQAISLGNIIGSVVYNTFFILGLTALINPIIIGKYYLNIGLCGVAVILLLAFLHSGNKQHILRREGALLFVTYCAMIVIFVVNG